MALACMPDVRESKVIVGWTPSRILLVDDDQELLGTIEEFLTRCSYTVSACGTSRGCLELMQAAAFDVALIDGTLERRPAMNTIRALKRINPQMAVIVLTGLTDCEHRREAIESGADDYVTKPVSLNALEALVCPVYQPHEVEMCPA